MRLRTIVMFSAFMLLLGCSGNESSDSCTGEHYVQYVVSTYSQDAVQITYIDETGQEKSTSGTYDKKSWRYSFCADSGTRLYVCAVRRGTLATEVLYSSIFVDSVEQCRNNTNMPDAATDCEYTIPPD